MSNEYYQAGSTPAPNSPGSSATIRGQFAAIVAAFDKLPTMAGSADEFVIVNSSGTALIASGYSFFDFVNLTGSQVLTNKTLAWADNTWVGFGTGATKNAGTGAGNVLLLAENLKLPTLDGSQLTNLTPSALGVVPIVNGGTGAANLTTAKINLGINLKADANNAVLTGAPTCPTPPVGNSSARLANTQFVTDTITAIGATIPSDATPLMNGAASSGVNAFVSRDDHVHPTDTTRAPTASPSFTGTITHSGDVVLSGTGKRITGDFTSSTVADRVMFQTNVVNGASGVVVAPNGISTSAVYGVLNTSDPTNASVGELRINSTEVRIASEAYGAGTYLPMTFFTGVSERMRIETDGRVGIGTPIPTSKLTVLTNTNDGITVNDGVVNTVLFNTAGVQASLGTTTPHNLTLWVNNSERARIDTNGDVSVGAYYPIGAQVGRTNLTIKGRGTGPSDSAAVVKLVTNAPGSTNPLIGNLEWYVPDNTGSVSQRVALIYCSVDGGYNTPNNKGASLTFATKKDGESGWGNPRLVITSVGDVLVMSPAGLGYAPGAGGTVTQATSKSTDVTLNKPCGEITMNAETLAAGAQVGFALHNNLLSSVDHLLLTMKGGVTANGRYQCWVSSTALSGSHFIMVKNISSQPLSEPLVIKFVIIRGATA